MSSSPIQVLVVDDNEIMRESLAAWLEVMLPGCVVQYASTGEDAVKLAETSPPDMALMDISLPGINGIEAARRIKARHPGVQVIMLTVYEAGLYRTEAARAGASAFVTKSQMHTMLLPAIRDALQMEQE